MNIDISAGHPRQLEGDIRSQTRLQIWEWFVKVSIPPVLLLSLSLSIFTEDL